ncbi:MAG: hypothetical protein N2606_01620 [Candidatus Omnitrophica bacterium]|nr:hypothetical protein [Candidatus Omnitrophota bacterium]
MCNLILFVRNITFSIGLVVLTLLSFYTRCAYCLDYQFPELVQIEAEYIISCQYVSNPSSPAYGAINNVQGNPTWVVPRENALAILGLLMAEQILENPKYRKSAELCADYLIRIQDRDGAWFNQYTFDTPGSGNPNDTESLAKSPTQAAEVMLALYRLGLTPARYQAMKKAANYLMLCQKYGGDGKLLGGGKDKDGNFRSWRWASDNSWAYQALKAAELWAWEKRDWRFAIRCAQAARRILLGINSTLYIKNPYSADYGVWYRVVDQNNQPIEPEKHDWINYAPQMLNVPAWGVNHPRVGRWIAQRLQKSDGACVWDDYFFTERRSPGYTFQAVLVWRKTGQSEFYIPALRWTLDSGLWQIKPDDNGIAGGWIDWLDYSQNSKANWWERFIDTSFYAIAAFNGGYNFSPMPRFLRTSYCDFRKTKDTLPFYFMFDFTALEQMVSSDNKSGIESNE